MSEQRYSTGEQWIAKRDLLRKIMDATEYERASAFVDGLADALAEAEAERDYLRQACAWMDDPAKEIAEMREREDQLVPLEFRDTFKVLVKEAQDLRFALIAKDARIAELEDHLGTLVDACNMASHGCPVCGNTSAEEDCTETCGLVQAQLALEAK